MIREIIQEASGSFVIAMDTFSDQDKKGTYMVANVETGGLIEFNKFKKLFKDKPGSIEDGFVFGSKKEAEKEASTAGFEKGEFKIEKVG